MRTSLLVTVAAAVSLSTALAQVGESVRQRFEAGLYGEALQLVTERREQAFLKLAPKAPERPAVESIMRTLRGR